MSQTNEDYLSAMKILDELCVRHDVHPSDKVRELFWRGVLLGQNRSNDRKFGPHLPVVAMTEKDPVGAERLPRRNPAAVPRQSSGSDQFNADELGDAGSFRL